MVFLYVMAGVYRLARFNVVQAGDRSRGYVGLPIPVAGMTLAAFYLFDDRFDFVHPAVSTFVLCGLFAALMVGGIRYDWPKLMYHGSRLQKIQSTILLVIVLLMALVPGVVLFPALFFYVIYGIVRAIAAWIRGDVTAGELIHPVKTS
jgi:phosphatidylserine synthase